MTHLHRLLIWLRRSNLLRTPTVSSPGPVIPCSGLRLVLPARTLLHGLPAEEVRLPLSMSISARK
jgi:hypothetical protein